MFPGNYNICSETFKCDIRKGFSLLQQQEFVDVTIAAGGRLTKAHQNILALASPYLKAFLQSASCQHPVIFLSNIGHEVLSYILEYIYTGEVQVPSTIYPSFLDAAKQMHIVGLENLSSFMDMRPLDSHTRHNDTLLDMIVDGVAKETGPEPAISDQTDKDYNLTENSTKYLTELSNSIDLSNPQQNSIVITFNEPVEQNTNETPMHAVVSQSDDIVPDNMEGNIEVNYNLIQQENPNDPPQSCSSPNTVQSHEHDLLDKTKPLYTKSIRGCLKMILNRFLYNLHHQSENGLKRRWRCVDYRRKHCLAYVDTKDEIIVSRKNIHSHGFHDSKILSTGAKKNIFTSIQQATR